MTWSRALAKPLFLGVVLSLSCAPARKREPVTEADIAAAQKSRDARLATSTCKALPEHLTAKARVISIDGTATYEIVLEPKTTLANFRVDPDQSFPAVGVTLRNSGIAGPRMRTEATGNPGAKDGQLFVVTRCYDEEERLSLSFVFPAKPRLGEELPVRIDRT